MHVSLSTVRSMHTHIHIQSTRKGNPSYDNVPLCRCWMLNYGFPSELYFYAFVFLVIARNMDIWFYSSFFYSENIVFRICPSHNECIASLLQYTQFVLPLIDKEIYTLYVKKKSSFSILAFIRSFICNGKWQMNLSLW